MDRPDWWSHELAISPHVVERMADRGFTEIDLRAMLEDARDCRPSSVPGRHVIAAAMGAELWEVVVEPDDLERVLIVVTAYRIE